MSSVKLFALSMAIVFISCSTAFAGAPAPMMERPIPVEQVTPPPTPTPASEGINPLVLSKHFTIGLGWGGNPLAGFVEKDGYGYPKTEYGICTGIGFAMTWFKGQPTPEELKAAENKVRAANPNIAEKDVPSAVRNELGVNTLSYVGLGVLNAEMGYEAIWGDNLRARIGIGLPPVVSFGVNYDF